jgi:hypothetical protein
VAQKRVMALRGLREAAPVNFLLRRSRAVMLLDTRERSPIVLLRCGGLAFLTTARAPCRSVIFAFGHRRPCGPIGGNRRLEVIDTGDVLDDVVTAIVPDIDFERRSRSWSSRCPAVQAAGAMLRRSWWPRRLPPSAKWHVRPAPALPIPSARVGLAEPRKRLVTTGTGSIYAGAPADLCRWYEAGIRIFIGTIALEGTSTLHKSSFHAQLRVMPLELTRSSVPELFLASHAL